MSGWGVEQAADMAAHGREDGSASDDAGDQTRRRLPLPLSLAPLLLAASSEVFVSPAAESPPSPPLPEQTASYQTHPQPQESRPSAQHL